MSKTTPTINWPTEPGWYLIENYTPEYNDSITRRVLHIDIFTESSYRGFQFITPGAYIHDGRSYILVQSYCSMGDRPWEELRFAKLDLAALAERVFHDEDAHYDRIMGEEDSPIEDDRDETTRHGIGGGPGY